jgi:hypothetical protein
MNATEGIDRGQTILKATPLLSGFSSCRRPLLKTLKIDQ